MPLKRGKPTPTEELSETSGAAPVPEAPSDDLDRVREILFGSQAEEQRSGLARVESRVEQATGELRDDVRAEISSLERMVTNKVNTVTSRFNTEYKSRVQGMEQLEAKLGELDRSIDTKLAELQEQTAANQRELRDQVFSQVQLLHTAIQQRHEEAVGLVTKQVDEVKTASTDRSSLADMLVELASKLSDGSPSRPGRPARGGDANANGEGHGEGATAS